VSRGARSAESRIIADPLQSPLGHLKGDVPESPAWFQWALTEAPERTRVIVDGAEVEVLAWGRRGDPGLLLLHGFAAHADWWSFIAPFFADTHRVVALSFTGMGLSDWREHYSMDHHSAEVMAAAEAAGVFEGPDKPVIVGHSYGSIVTLFTVARHGARFKAAVAVDSPMSENDRERPNPPAGPGAQRVYHSLPAALARFRFAPPQPCENLFIVDHIARLSLKPKRTEDGEAGWAWRFDPELRSKMDFGSRAQLLAGPQCPLALMIGARSKLMTPERLDFMKRTAPEAPWIEIPDAGHHLMADQPLAFVAGLRGLLAGWPRSNA
jgi:pimeloyl-ACP methyl ester carboxylesterase